MQSKSINTSVIKLAFYKSNLYALKLENQLISIIMVQYTLYRLMENVATPYKTITDYIIIAH